MRRSSSADGLNGGGERFPSLRRRGKQSVWLSACRTPNPKGENRAAAQTHLEAVFYKKLEVILSNRKRNLTVTIRVTPEEKDAILRKAAEADMTLTDYLITAALSREIHVAENMKPVVAELKRIGTNLNQIAMKINAGAFRSYNFSEVNECQRKLYEEVCRIGRGG